MIYSNKELVIMVGITGSGKSYHVNKYYVETHQYISEKHIDYGISKEQINIGSDFKYAILAVITRALMKKELPIIVDDNNLSIEGLFVWKKFAIEYGYKLKVILVEAPIDVCIERLCLQDTTDEYIKILKKQEEMYKELKQILNMKYQKIVDEYEVISYGGN